MAASTPSLGLIDFIYRDPNRVIALASQFGVSKLTSETTQSNRDSDEKSKGLGVAAMVKGDWSNKAIEERVTSVKEVRDVKDLIVYDLLASLMEKGMISPSPVRAKSSSIVRVTGKLFVFDPMHMDMFESIGKKSNYFGGSKAEFDKTVTLIKGTKFPPTFYIVDDNDQWFFSTFHESGLLDTIYSLGLRIGKNGLENVNLIGIKETRSSTSMGNLPLILNISANVSGAMTDMLKPPDGIGILPICMYRDVETPD